MFIKDLYNTGLPVVSFEVFPPKKDAAIDNVHRTLRQLSGYSPDFISVTHGAGASGNVGKTLEIASYILRECSVLSLAHLTGVGAEREDVLRALEEMRGCGVCNTLALRGDLPEGDPPRGGFPHAEDLIREIRETGGFCIGAACYPEGHIECDDLTLDTVHLRRKQEAGADFLITQLFFDNDIFFRFLERARAGGVTIPVSAGVMPILSRTQIERMIFMCGASLPSDIIKLLHRYEKSPDDLRRAGIEHAAIQLEGLIRGGAQGVHIYTMNKPDIAEQCMRHIGRISS